jgi:heme/copper-type cytochrome/quinol oxidase subunit 2
MAIHLFILIYFIIGMVVSILIDKLLQLTTIANGPDTAAQVVIIILSWPLVVTICVMYAVTTIFLHIKEKVNKEQDEQADQ